MIKIELENEIIQNISRQYRPRWISLKQEWKNYLLQRWEDCNNIKESYLRIKYNIVEVPKCPICGNCCHFHGGDTYIYDKTCGDEKCIKTLKKINSDKTKIEKYGNANYNNYEKVKQTKLERYGDENYNNTKQALKNRDYKKIQEKIKKTCLERYGVENGGGSKESLEKIKKTCLERYGVKSSWEIPGVKEKSKRTKLERYGNENYTNIEKYKQTCLEKYGVDNVFKNKEIQEKYKQTCLERYGVDHNWKIPGEHDLTHTKEALEKKKLTLIKHYGVDHPHKSPIIQNKINITKRKNNSFNISKLENISYDLLKEKYQDVKRQYKSELYPYLSDFYIPSLDLYIECNYHWTHGKHAYNKTNQEDNLILEKWKQKNTEFYDNAIDTWSIRDVKKRETARQNNLNYIEFFDITQLQNWIKNGDK